MGRGIALAVVVLCVALVAGCNGEDDQPTSDPDAATAEVEATMDRIVDDPAASCDLFDSRQLTESFGKRDPETRCQESVERHGEDTPFTAYEVMDVKGRCARVDVEGQRGGDAVFFMKETDGQWLVHNIEEPPVSTDVGLCGEVRLLGNT